MSNKPWQDFDRLREVRKKHDTQSEMADELGCSAPTVSNWLSKLKEKETSNRYADPDSCHFFDVCGNETPGAGNSLCERCLDLLRKENIDGMSDTATMEDLYKHNG